MKTPIKFLINTLKIKTQLSKIKTQLSKNKDTIIIPDFTLLPCAANEY